MARHQSELEDRDLERPMRELQRGCVTRQRVIGTTPRRGWSTCADWDVCQPKYALSDRRKFDHELRRLASVHRSMECQQNILQSRHRRIGDEDLRIPNFGPSEGQGVGWSRQPKLDREFGEGEVMAGDRGDVDRYRIKSKYECRI
jgi:hypothetical protein